MRRIFCFLLVLFFVPGLWARSTPHKKLLKAARYTVRYRYFKPAELLLGDKGYQGKEYYNVYYDSFFRVIGVMERKNGKNGAIWRYSYAIDGSRKLCVQFRGRLPRYAWEYDSLGRVKKKLYYAGYYSPYKWTKYVYNHKGKLFMRKTFIKGKLLAYSYFEYHPDGSLFFKTDYTSGGNVSGRSFYKTDTKGKVIKAYVYGWGRLTKVVVYRYNQLGLVVEKRERRPRKGDLLNDPYHKKPVLKKRAE